MKLGWVLMTEKVTNLIGTFLEFSLIIEGTTEKVLQFIILLKSVYIYNRGFNAQKMVF
jgi:hypothetical protein